jgi:ribosome-associated translation inhibitor RaiA
MANTNSPTGCSRILMIAIIACIAIPLYKCNKWLSSSDTNKPIVNTEPAPVFTESEYLAKFKADWDSVKLETNNTGIPPYSDILNALDKIEKQMTAASQKIGSDSIEKLRQKFDRSKKYKIASINWLTWGQPQEYELKSACEMWFKRSANDPSSVEFGDSGISGRSKNGWIYQATIRAKNGFGALIVQTWEFDVRHNDPDYYVNYAHRIN